MRGHNVTRAVGVLVVVALVATGCGSTSPKATRPRGSSGATTTSQAPRPAGKYPSAISKEVCAGDAQREIAEALGLKTTRVSTPTWVDHVYSCRYEYATGSFTLSVNELSSWGQTLDFFHGLAGQFGKARALANLGQGAFSETSGNVVVRKDWKVLTVDVSGLPPQFGVPPTSAGDVAVTVAIVILGCWAGD